MTLAVLEVTRGHAARGARFGAVSLASIVSTQLLLAALFATGLGPGAANAIAVSTVAIPTYAVSRWWVWRGQHPETRVRQGIAFWVVAMVGLLVSTGLVAGLVPGDAPVLHANIVSVAAFGAVWVGKFLVLDRVVFES
jgi:putative flippase GtrA